MISQKLLFLSCVGLIGFAVTSCAPQKSVPQVSTNVTAKTFKKEVLESKLPVIVKISATWCGPCQQFYPIFEKVAAKYGDIIKFVSIDYDSNLSIVDEYEITSVPTMLLFYNGELLGTQEGRPRSVEEFEKMIEQYRKFLEKTSKKK